MKIRSTAIPGLLLVDLDLPGDNRGWFKENWQREKMVAAGLPDFHPVQHNISFNAAAGVTRGLHGEPWDKFVSVAYGKVFGAWCDLREGSSTFGQVVTATIDPGTAVFVPRGVANGFQALEPSSYSYLVNDHWSADAQYPATSLELIDWPLPPSDISDKDRHHPPLDQVVPMAPRRILVSGAAGQLGRALQEIVAAGATNTAAAYWDFLSREDWDLRNIDPTNPLAPTGRRWQDYQAIINCAAYNNVNGAQQDRATAWEVNAQAPAALAQLCTAYHLTLVHISTDYIFDGSQPLHSESEPASALSVYGATKAAGDLAAQGTPQHFVLRTSWVVGEGANFVDTMVSLAERGISPQVVDDQRGRPTFASELARGICHLMGQSSAPRAAYGVYNLSNSGDIVSRAELAQAAVAAAGWDPALIVPISTAQYDAAFPGQAPRPAQSAFSLAKILSTGFEPQDWRVALAGHVARR